MRLFITFYALMKTVNMCGRSLLIEEHSSEKSPYIDHSPLSDSGGASRFFPHSPTSPSPAAFCASPSNHSEPEVDEIHGAEESYVVERVCQVVECSECSLSPVSLWPSRIVIGVGDSSRSSSDSLAKKEWPQSEIL